MCGLAGILERPGQTPAARAQEIVTRMTDAIAHRGPDSSGQWQDHEAGIILGHRRLAIVELSTAGHQPMASASERYVLAYNGEIYNHSALRTELEQHRGPMSWRGHSDTETLAAGFDVWGIADTLRRCTGMFALAIWDRKDRRLMLARDRLGEKPLYYGWQRHAGQSVFLFGSELSAVQAHPACGSTVNRGAITQLLRHGHVGEGLSILEGIHKLPAGHIMEVTHASQAPQSSAYWDAAQIAAARSPGVQIPRDPQAATDALETLLLEATARQMTSSDVPLGAFLSGGIDSSAVVGLMQHMSDRPVHTFSIGFQEPRYDEAGFAKEVACHLGTHHTEHYLSDTDLLDVVPQLASMFSEPFADSSQIPTYLVARLAREHVTVALSGDGGDELFCGYDRYRQGTRMMRYLDALPRQLRQAGAGAVRGIPAHLWGHVIDPFKPTPQGKETNGQRLHRLADYATSADVEELHRKMVSRWRFPQTAVLGGAEPPSLLAENLPGGGDLNAAERMMQLDTITYLPDDILTKVDRACMAVSLESRAPLLDHRVAEFAFALPFDMKLRDGKSKWLLRQVLYRHVPAALIERPKMGFEVPIGLWLRGALRDWAADLLSPDRLKREGYLHPEVITTMWRQHLAGSHNWGMQLWPVLMFQSWLAHQSGTA